MILIGVDGDRSGVRPESTSQEPLASTRRKLLLNGVFAQGERSIKSDRADRLASMSKPLSLNEIRTRIDRFVFEWKDETSERAEAQTFWNELLDCFGISRRRVAVFEQRARRASTGNSGRIDVFWPGVLIAEHKSAGEMKKDRAYKQASDYLEGGDISDPAFPRYIITSDFQNFRVTDLEAPVDQQTVTFPLTDLAKHINHLSWIAGYSSRRFSTEEAEAASIKAAKIMSDLYVALAGDLDTELVIDESEEDQKSLTASVLLTRLLFLLYGDDAGLWEKGLFDEFLRNRTVDDGSDLGSQLNTLFDILNTPEDKRDDRANPEFLAFPYVNGDLYAKREPTQFFDSKMRSALMAAADFDWTSISPAVFGSLFQSVKSKEARRSDGEHYTTEENILKTIEPLFLDDVRAKVKASWNSANRLRELHNSFANFRYLDPACGCGNFLIVAYREMRRIELEVLVRLRELEGNKGQWAFEDEVELKVSLDQFHGIEINWWPAKIAETAMFLVDHQANREMVEALGESPTRLPIKKAAQIHHGNALRLDWKTLLPPSDSTLVFGNPPFLGDHTRGEEQLADLQVAWGQNKQLSRLDFVTGWHAKAMDYFRNHKGIFGFVTTNSITQGDQAHRLFEPLRAAGWQIKFAHRTFAWNSEAPGKAGVHCVIVGFTKSRESQPRLFDYATPKSKPVEVHANHINPYLVDGPDVHIPKRTEPLSSELSIAAKGSMPTDDGNFMISPEDYDQVMADPVAAKYVRRFVGASELIHGTDRWCLWLKDADPNDISKSKIISGRVRAVRDFRSESKAASTRNYPHHHLFRQFGQPEGHYLCIPAHVSEARRYYPTGRFDSSVINGNANFSAPDPDGFLFAIISSSMFLTWQKAVGGTLESRLRFSSTIVWNNLPLPPMDAKTRSQVVAAGEAVLSARAEHPERSLAEHYNPLAMDPALVTAHDKLDAVVDRAFGAKKTCTSERERQEILFARYLELTNPLGTDTNL